MTAQIAITVNITNSYPELGRKYIHDETVTVDAPADKTVADPDRLADWALDQLIDFTGEGPEYADTYGVYAIVVTAAPAEYAPLVGVEAYAEG